MDEWKDGDTRELVNRLTECGERFGHTEQLRERIATIVRPFADRLKQPPGDVVVTRNEAGRIVAVTRQDEEGRILSVIAEGQP